MDDESDYSGLVEAALIISAQRTEQLREIKAQLEAGNDQEALRLMRIHVAAEKPQARSSAKKKINDPR